MILLFYFFPTVYALLITAYDKVIPEQDIQNKELLKDHKESAIFNSAKFNNSNGLNRAEPLRGFLRLQIY